MGSQCASFFLLQAIFTVVNMYLQVILKNQGFSYAVIGIMFAVFELAGMIGQVGTGWFADKTGLLRVTQLSCAVATILGTALLIRLTSIPLAFLVLFPLGFFLNSLITLQDAAANQFGGGKPDVYSKIRACGTIGCTCFSLVYAMISRPAVSDNQDIFLFVAGGAVAYMVSLPFLKTGSETVPRQTGKRKGGWFDTPYLLAIGCILLSRFSMATTRFIPLYAVEVLGYHKLTMLQVVSTGTEFVAILVTGKLLREKKVRPVTLLMVSSVGVGLRQLCYALMPSVFGMMLGQAFHSLCYGVFQPAVIRFVTLHVKSDHKAEGIALCQSLGSGLGGMLGELFCGLVIQHFGYTVLFFSYAVPAFASAFLLLLLRRYLQKVEVQRSEMVV